MSARTESGVRELLRTPEVADYLGVSPRTVEDWRRRRVGPTWFRTGPRAVAYRRADLEAWLSQRRQAAQPNPEPADRVCIACDGAGVVGRLVCMACEGDGRITEAERARQEQLSDSATWGPRARADAARL